MNPYEYFTLLLILTVTNEGKTLNTSQRINPATFPDYFIFGTASSAYQIEGSWNIDGKSENIWDHETHFHSDRIKDGSNGDVTCDSYKKYQEDIALLKDLRVNFYRFSLSWTRILPSGFPNKINRAGIDYYNRLINELLADGIMPMVTIYHWDLPQTLQNLGGIANPLIEQWFLDYARIVFTEFGDRVKFWTTFNEPKQICLSGYGQGTLAPGVKSDGIGDYICNHNLLKAHARAYHLYDQEFRPQQKGTIGIVIECRWFEPVTNTEADIQAAGRKRQFDCGLYAHPIFGRDGDYPATVKDYVSRRSKDEGFKQSRLPTFTQKEIRYIQGTSDYFGLNYYTSFMGAYSNPEPIGDPSQDKDTQVTIWQEESWPGSEPFLNVPWGFRKILKWIKDNYDNPDIYVTENGFPDTEKQHDNGRIDYLVEHLSSALDAIYEDGVSLKGYTVWSLLDYFEWDSGYTIGFGMYDVDFSNPLRPRKAKDSVAVYRDIIKNRKLPLTNL